MNRNIPTLVLVVFAGVVFVLGYVIVQRAGLLFESEVDNVQEFSPFAFVEPKNVLNWPSMEASDNEKQQHTQLIVSLAQQADTLEIKEGCMVSPVVLGIQLKASVVVANLDSGFLTAEENFLKSANTIPQLESYQRYSTISDSESVLCS